MPEPKTVRTPIQIKHQTLNVSNEIVTTPYMVGAGLAPALEARLGGLIQTKYRTLNNKKTVTAPSMVGAGLAPALETPPWYSLAPALETRVCVYVNIYGACPCPGMEV